jgi:hypothetical protein
LVQVSEDYSNVWSMSTEQMLTNVVHNDWIRSHIFCIYRLKSQYKEYV